MRYANERGYGWPDLIECNMRTRRDTAGTISSNAICERELVVGGDAHRTRGTRRRPKSLHAPSNARAEVVEALSLPSLVAVEHSGHVGLAVGGLELPASCLPSHQNHPLSILGHRINMRLPTPALNPQSGMTWRIGLQVVARLWWWPWVVFTRWWSWDGGGSGANLTSLR